MPYHVPPPLPPNPDWQPAPHFIPTDDFGVVPNFAPAGTPLDPETFGPPDPLKTLRDALDAIAFQCTLAQRQESGAFAGHGMVACVNALIEEIAGFAAAFPNHPRSPREHLTRLPAGVLLAMPDLLEAIRPAQRAADALVRLRAAIHALRLLPAEELRGPTYPPPFHRR